MSLFAVLRDFFNGEDTCARKAPLDYGQRVANMYAQAAEHRAKRISESVPVTMRKKDGSEITVLYHKGQYHLELPCGHEEVDWLSVPDGVDYSLSSGAPKELGWAMTAHYSPNAANSEEKR